MKTFIQNKDDAINKAMELSSELFNIDRFFITYNSRKREIVEARQFAHYLMAMFYPKEKCSLSWIGQEIGEKDHATVLHSKRTFANLLKTDKQINKNAKPYITDFIDWLTKESVNIPDLVEKAKIKNVVEHKNN